MEVVWEEGEVHPKDEWMTPPVMEQIRDAVAVSRVTCRPIKKIMLTKSEKTRFDNEIDFLNAKFSKDSIMGVELEVAND